jgi:hypothetical protein
MEETYAVIPEGAASATAYFIRLEVAIEWGLRQYGSAGFRIRKADPVEARMSGLSVDWIARPRALVRRRRSPAS